MLKYDARKFLQVLQDKIDENKTCPFCGGNSFNVLDSFATIITGKEVGKITLGTSAPAGLIVCDRCGHMEFFALGVLGLLKDEGTSDGENTNKD